MCVIIKESVYNGSLTVVGNIININSASGSGSPCLDLNMISKELNDTSVDVDLIVIEGMGRAIHTNFKARFTCDSIKIAVFKNPFVCELFGCKMYDGMVLFEQAVDCDNTGALVNAVI
jgi:hypothetical protein